MRVRYNYPDVITVVLDGDDSHDVGGVLCVRVRAVLVGQHQTGVSLVDLGSLQVQGVHERALEVFDPRVLPLQKSLELQVRLSSVQKHDVNVNIIAVLVEEICEEDGHGLKGDVATDHDVSKEDS